LAAAISPPIAATPHFAAVSAAVDNIFMLMPMFIDIFAAISRSNSADTPTDARRHAIDFAAIAAISPLR
jgi:hypothetical protein